MINNKNKRVIIQGSKSYDFVFLNEIIRIEGLQNFSRVYLSNGQILVSSCSIGVLRKALEKENFFSCHKSHVINVTHMVRFHKDGYIEMSDTSSVPVSRRRREALLEEVISNYCLTTGGRDTIDRSIQSISKLEVKKI